MRKRIQCDLQTLPRQAPEFEDATHDHLGVRMCLVLCRGLQLGKHLMVPIQNPAHVSWRLGPVLQRCHDKELHHRLQCPGLGGRTAKSLVFVLCCLPLLRNSDVCRRWFYTSANFILLFDLLLYPYAGSLRFRLRVLRAIRRSFSRASAGLVCNHGIRLVVLFFILLLAAVLCLWLVFLNVCGRIKTSILVNGNFSGLCSLKCLSLLFFLLLLWLPSQQPVTELEHELIIWLLNANQAQHSCKLGLGLHR
mmetsp:Transcript_160074/g.292211  ORF Transcript_160074/g.292211 Transcript_160074/m.292211 type:complete len:250 (-) Transcript_160074:1510-2259(-)